MINNITTFSNVTYAVEDNFSLIDKSVDIWGGSLPYTTGCKFPTAKIKNRANELKTSRLLFYNEQEDIFNSLLSVFPEIDPTTGWQIREIIGNLPHFRNCINSWVGIICGIDPSIDYKDNDLDSHLNKIVSSSNFNDVLLTEVTNTFLEDTSFYIIESDLKGEPHIRYIDSKNVVLFVNKEHIDEVEVAVVFNINESENTIEFIEYHYNGFINKRVFVYSDGIIGSEIVDRNESGKWIEGVDISPLVICTHNKLGNDVYGHSMLNYWSTSVVAVERAFQNLLRMGEHLRELMRKVPESAIKRDSVTGASMFFNKGVISYPDGTDKIPEIGYEIPDIAIDKAIGVFDKAIESLSNDTKLGQVFFGIEKAGSNLSAKSIEAMLYPTKLEGLRIQKSIVNTIKDMVFKLCISSNFNINKFDINILWEDSFPKDEKEHTEAIMQRLNADIPTITLQDAIVKLDHVNSRTALLKANEILGKLNSRENKEIFNDVKVSNDDISIDNISNSDIIEGEVNTNRESNTLWETQMLPVFTPIVKSKSGGNEWYLRKLRRSH
jgi:hypothetical protein